MGEEQGYSHIVQKMANSYILFVVMFIFSFLLCLWITWDDPVNKETPNSTYANFKEFPRTNGLISPKDTKENLLNFWGQAECIQKRNKSLLQAGLE